MSSLFFWFVYFTLDDVYKVNAVFIVVLVRMAGQFHCNLPYICQQPLLCRYRHSRYNCSLTIFSHLMKCNDPDLDPIFSLSKTLFCSVEIFFNPVTSFNESGKTDPKESDAIFKPLNQGWPNHFPVAKKCGPWNFLKLYLLNGSVENRATYVGL